MARAGIGRVAKWSVLSLVIVAVGLGLSRARSDSAELERLAAAAEEAGLPVSQESVDRLLGEPPSPESVRAFRHLVEVRSESEVDAFDVARVAEIFAGLTGPLIDAPLPGRVPNRPSSFTYSKRSKAAIGDALGKAVANGTFDDCPVMRSHNRGNLRNLLVPRCNAAAEEAMLQGIDPMIRAYRTGKGALIESWAATGSHRPPVARLWGDNNTTDTSTTVDQFSRSYLRALAARHPAASDNARRRGVVKLLTDPPVIELRATFDPGPESLAYLVTVDPSILKPTAAPYERPTSKRRLPVVLRRQEPTTLVPARTLHPARWRAGPRSC